MGKRLQQAKDKFYDKVFDKASTAAVTLILAAVVALVAYFRQAHDAIGYFWLGVFCTCCLFAPLAFIQRHRRKTREQKDRWLPDFAEADRQNLGKCVRVERCQVNLRGLTSDPRYMDFSLTVFNGSVFKISVEDVVKGSIVFRNQPLTGSRDIIHNVKNIGRAEVGRFTLRQMLDDRHAELISEALEDKEDWLIFDHLTITISGGRDQPEIKPQRLNLMKAVTKSGEVIWHRE